MIPFAALPERVENAHRHFANSGLTMGKALLIGAVGAVVVGFIVYLYIRSRNMK